MSDRNNSNSTSVENKLRVLIVDDDRDQAEGMVDLLIPRGYQVAIAHNIEETRRQLQKFEAQLAIIDLRLGQESGIDLVKELKDTHPQLKCVLLTAYADLDNTIEALKEGVFDFLRKPLSPASLFISLERCSKQIQLDREKLRAKEIINREKERLNKVLNLIPGFVCLQAKDYSIRFFNNKFRELFGAPDGRPCYKILRNRDLPCKKCPTLVTFESKTPNTWEWTTENNRVYLIHEEIVPATATDEEMVMIIGIDITDQKRTEEALGKRIIALTQPLETGDENINFTELFNLDEIQHIQDLFAKAMGVAAIITHPDGTPITKPSNFCHLCANIIRKTPEGLKRCIRSDSIIGRVKKNGPIIQPCLSCGLWNAGASITVGGKHLANWLIGQVRNEAQDEQLAARYAKEIGADEETFCKAFREVPVMSDKQFKNAAQMLYAIASQLSNMAYQNVEQARFISARKQAEKQLQHERDFSTQIANSLPGLFYVFDEKRFVKWNPKFEELLGYSSEEISHKYGPDFFEGADKQIISERMQDTFINGATEVEAEIITKDGRKIPYFFTGARCIFDGKPHIVGLGIDITERKRIEAEREQLIAKLETQNAELERFTYTVSHDLKSPLITVKGFVGMMQQDLAKGDSAAVDEDLARISAAADKMDQLLRELLELSRIGRLINPSEEIPLQELIEDAMELAHGQIVRRGVKVAISPNLPTVYGDRLRLLEVLQNLIDNAIKYMGDQPHPHIEIGSRREGSETIYYVRDNGIGIDSNYHDKVFGLFEQLDQHVEGSGIGLALVKRIIEIHGGRIWVESEGGDHGSCFCFTLAAKPDSH